MRRRECEDVERVRRVRPDHFETTPPIGARLRITDDESMRRRHADHLEGIRDPSAKVEGRAEHGAAPVVHRVT